MGIAIVLPANWPVEDDEAHCTLMFLGNVKDATFTEQQLWEIVNGFDWPLLSVPTAGIEMFGPNHDIPVLRLQSIMLHRFHDELETFLNNIGIYSASEFTDYKPHVTIKDYREGMYLPPVIHLGTPKVWWGDNWNMQDGDECERCGSHNTEKMLQCQLVCGDCGLGT